MSILRYTVIQERPWDFAGIGTSLLCVAHCVATPLLVVLIPAIEIFERETHTAFALTILCIGLLAFVPGFRRHRRWRVVLSGLIGFGMLSAGALVPEGTMSETVEKGLTVLGGITLVSAHLSNAYFCRLCRVCGKEPCATVPVNSTGA